MKDGAGCRYCGAMTTHKVRLGGWGVVFACDDAEECRVRALGPMAGATLNARQGGSANGA